MGELMSKKTQTKFNGKKNYRNRLMISIGNDFLKWVICAMADRSVNIHRFTLIGIYKSTSTIGDASILTQ